MVLCALTMLLSSYRKQGEREVYATYYDYGFRNKLTASGTKYNPNTLTCATFDRSIPFGTVLEVTNVKNGKSVRVTVNDRMGRTVRGKKNPNSLDLSVASFKKLAELKTGRIKVTYVIIKKGDGRTYHNSKNKNR